MRLSTFPWTLYQTREIQNDADIGEQENMNNTLKAGYFFCQIILSPVSKDKGIDPAKLY